MLDSFTNEQLEAELERRKVQKPRQVERPVFLAVIEACQQYIDEIFESGWGDGNSSQHIFEVALEAVYGEDIWDFMRKRWERNEGSSTL